MPPKIHYALGAVAGGLVSGLCGILSHLGTTEEPGVTCALCQKRLRARRQVAAVKAGARMYQGEDLRQLRDGVEGLASIVAGEYIGPRRSARLETRWASIGHALSEMVAADLDGPPTSSMSDPRRIERMTGRLGGFTTAGAVSRVEELSDDLHSIRSAWAAAFSGWHQAPLSDQQARTATLLRYVGGQASDGERRPLSPSEIAALFEAHDIHATPKNVGRVTRRAGTAVYQYLRERGLVPERARAQGAQMADSVTDNDLVGWPEIARFLRVSVQTAQRYERDLAMPVHRFMRQVEASTDELKAWRQGRTTLVCDGT